MTRLRRSAPVKPGRLPGERRRCRSPWPAACRGCGPRGSSRGPCGRGGRRRSGGRSGPGAAAPGRGCRAVGGGDQDDVVRHREAVHLDEQLVERLLALVVPAAHAGAAVAADGVDLVHEDDAGRVLLGLLEEVAHARGADADEHLDEVRAGDREERHAGLAGDGAGQQRLAGARRAVEQHALGDPGAERLELLGVLQELLDLVELLDRLVDPRDVAEGDLRRVDATCAWRATCRRT